MDLTTRETIVALRRLIQKLQAKPGNLMLEVTERGFLNEDVGREILSDIRNEGMFLAIDDFGTGYSRHSGVQELSRESTETIAPFLIIVGVDSAFQSVS